MPDDGCTKCVIDNGMGINAARMYGRVLVQVSGLAGVDYEVADFYADVLVDCERVAQAVWHKLDKDERTALLVQVDKACYRADDLIAWSKKSETEIAERAATWTVKLFEWAKDDQTFYTALAVKHGHV
jgi:hypothetical protein